MAFWDEIYVTILSKVPLWFLNGNYIGEFCNRILALFFFFFFKASVALSLSDIPWNGPIGKLGFENKKQLIFAEIPSEHVIARA